MYENLRAIRKKWGLMCEQMAKVIDIQKANYIKKERGEVTFSLLDAKKYLIFLINLLKKFF